MENILILKIGGEGGSIKLLKINDQYAYTTNESALYDLLSKADREGMSFKSESELYDTFELAMESMIDRYPVFRLYPLEINDPFKEQINKYYQAYLANNKGDNYLRNEKWENILLPL